MGRARQPLELLDAKGKKHLTKAEKEERAATEVKAESPKYVRWPSYLPENLRKEFNEIAAALIRLNIFTKLDRDTLATYLMARTEYLQATAQVQTYLAKRDSEAAGEWAALQDKFFKQARACANDLGLTVTSRCRLVLPKDEKKEPEDEMEGMFTRRYG